MDSPAHSYEWPSPEPSQDSVHAFTRCLHVDYVPEV